MSKSFKALVLRENQGNTVSAVETLTVLPRCARDILARRLRGRMLVHPAL